MNNEILYLLEKAIIQIGNRQYSVQNILLTPPNGNLLIIANEPAAQAKFPATKGKELLTQQAQRGSMLVDHKYNDVAERPALPCQGTFVQKLIGKFKESFCAPKHICRKNVEGEWDIKKTL